MDFTDDIEERVRGIAHTDEFNERFEELVDLEKSFDHFDSQLDVLEQEFIDENETLPLETMPQKIEEFVRIVFRNECTEQYREDLVDNALEEFVDNLDELSVEEKREIIEDM